MVVANYTPGETAEGEFRLLREDPDGTRREIARWTLTLPPDSDSAVTAPLLPPETPPGTTCWIVFRGRLGGEPDAVAAGPAGCPLEPPSPPPPPPPTTKWIVYQCSDFSHTVEYRYALLWTGWAEDAPSRIYVTAWPQPICSKIAVFTGPEQPPGTVTEHPV